MKVNLLLSGSGQIAVLPALSGTFRLSLHHRKQGRMLNKLLSPFLASRQIPTPSPIDVYLVMVLFLLLSCSLLGFVLLHIRIGLGLHGAIVT